jgi:hypothetical protein
VKSLDDQQYSLWIKLYKYVRALMNMSLPGFTGQISVYKSPNTYLTASNLSGSNMGVYPASLNVQSINWGRAGLAAFGAFVGAAIGLGIGGAIGGELGKIIGGAIGGAIGAILSWLGL